MKKILGMASIAFLTGCASANYSDINTSQAVISNLKVTELGKAGTNKHQLDVKFDYSIKDYSDVIGLYKCSILFTSSQDKLVTVTTEREPCKIDSESGSISIKWDTPLSTSAGYSKESLRKMVLPLEYQVTIHQKRTKNSNVVIGMSQPLYITSDS